MLRSLLLAALVASAVAVPASRARYDALSEPLHFASGVAWTRPAAAAPCALSVSGQRAPISFEAS